MVDIVKFIGPLIDCYYLSLATAADTYDYVLFRELHDIRSYLAYHYNNENLVSILRQLFINFIIAYNHFGIFENQIMMERKIRDNSSNSNLYSVVASFFDF